MTNKSSDKDKTGADAQTTSESKEPASWLDAANKFKDTPSASSMENLRDEMEMDDSDPTEKLAALLEAIGSDAYNRYIHGDFSTVEEV